MTAAHDVRAWTGGRHVAAFVSPEQFWFGVDIEVVTIHPAEDVALLRLQPQAGWMVPESPLTIGGEDANASAGYRLWGYPEDVLHEVVKDGRATPRPDLVYSEGHIRRQLVGVELDHIRGQSFLELSEVAGAGCSGSPVTLRQDPRDPWVVIGVYVGERSSPTSGAMVGYATRSNAVLDLLEEAALTATNGQEDIADLD